MNWQHEKVTNLTLNLVGGIYKLQIFCEKKTSLKLSISIPRLAWLKRNNSIFIGCFSGVQLGHVQLLDFKGMSTAHNFDWHWAVFLSLISYPWLNKQTDFICIILWHYQEIKWWTLSGVFYYTKRTYFTLRKLTFGNTFHISCDRCSQPGLL